MNNIAMDFDGGGTPIPITKEFILVLLIWNNLGSYWIHSLNILGVKI